jgi:2-methylisocitrate lyase-like PEP mutase family enzyme
MAERFREMLASPSVIELPGCYDALSAMMLERSGFSCAFLSGYGVAAGMLGSPDIGLTSLCETATAARHTAHAISIPLVVDCDNGYGDADNVARTVREMEHAGAAAMILEDQVLPKRCGHTSNKKIIPLDQYLRKLERALEARRTPLVIIARTDAMDLDEAINRAVAFRAAGADATLVDGLPSIEAARRVAREVPGPVQVNLIYGGKTPPLPASEWWQMGFKIVLYSTPALFLCAATMLQNLRRLRETGELATIAEQSIGFREFQSFMEESYLRRHGRETGADSAG